MEKPLHKQKEKAFGFVFYVVIAFLVGLCAFLSLEVSFRVFYHLKTSNTHGIYNVFVDKGIHEASDNSLWEEKWSSYKPKAQLEKVLPDGSRFSIRINSKGYRTKEFGEKSENTLRIIAIGGSTTVQGMTNETTYPALLEKKLMERFPGRNIEVLNLGVSGGQAGRWRARFNQLISYEPDIVLQYNAINDISRPIHYKKYRNDFPVRSFFLKSLAVQWFFPVDPKDLHYVFDIPLEHFRVMNERLSERGIKYIVSTFAYPRGQLLDSDLNAYLDLNVMHFWGRGLDISFYKTYENLMIEYNRYLRKYTEDHSILLADVESSVFLPEHFVDACHMTHSGINKQAEAFYKKVVAVIQASFQ